ncbi:MAG: NADH:flavin oxidoreductase, Old yellow enzyme family [Firmicutes bacterium]|nr:NADH:flavin oxidoreductase, Old yellow enzyme family [Bacillota bacterium]
MIMRYYPNVFSPLKVGPITLKNRIALAPMSFTELDPKQGYSKDIIAYYEAVAKGGAAVVTLGESIVSMKNGKTHNQMVLVNDPKIFPTLANVVEAIHRHNALASIQISHGGAIHCMPENNGGRNPIGPTAYTRADGVQVDEMDEAMMNEVADEFAEAVMTLKRAGFDMVMFHAGHGWLISQFLSPRTNKRTDKYGGSLENCARFPIMVLDRIRKKVGNNFPIEMRMSGAELVVDGYDMDYAVAFAKMVEDKVDLIQVSAGGVFSDEGTRIMSPSIFFERGCNVYLAEAIKKAVTIPVTCVGGLAEPEMMEEIIAGGKADMVTVGRALIADPDLPKKAKQGRAKEILRCLRCTECHGRLFAKGSMKCSINPVVGREYENQFLIPPTSKWQKVMIAGGGPAGMQAALTASQRGHEVILCEKTNSLGGALKFADYVPFKKDLMYFREQLVRRVENSGTTVMLQTEATPELVKEIAPDVLIAAVGAEPIVPNIPGMNLANVILGTNVYTEETQMGQKLVIIGGGLIGCEIAVDMSRQGKEVTIIEMLGDVACDTNPPHKNGLMYALRDVHLQTNTKCLAITETGVVARDGDGNEKLFDADTVIVSVGMKSLSSVVDGLYDAASDYVIIGDCVKPGKVGDAVHGGYNAALDI